MLPEELNLFLRNTTESNLFETSPKRFELKRSHVSNEINHGWNLFTLL